MSFFKYSTTSTAEVVIKNKTLRWSSPLVFNDLEECQIQPWDEEHFNKSNLEYQLVLKEAVKGRLIFNYNQFSPETNMMISFLKTINSENKELGEFFPTLKNNSERFRRYINEGLLGVARILSLTDSPLNKLMWAHYADNHYGCCIEFKSVYKGKLNNLVEAPVSYRDSVFPSVTGIELLLYGETKERTRKMKEDIFFTKQNIWKYENEFRLMFNECFGEIKSTIDVRTGEQTSFEVSQQTNKKFSDVEFPDDAIESITFGARASSTDIERLKKLAREHFPEVRFYRVQSIGTNSNRGPLT